MWVQLRVWESSSCPTFSQWNYCVHVLQDCGMFGGLIWEPCAPSDAIIILRGPPAFWWSVWLLSLRLTCMVNLLLFLLRSVIKDSQEMTLWTIFVNSLRRDHILGANKWNYCKHIIIHKLAIKYLVVMLPMQLSSYTSLKSTRIFCFSFCLGRSSLHNILKGFCSFAV